MAALVLHTILKFYRSCKDKITVLTGYFFKEGHYWISRHRHIFTERPWSRYHRKGRVSYVSNQTYPWSWAYLGFWSQKYSGFAKYVFIYLNRKLLSKICRFCKVVVSALFLVLSLHHNHSCEKLNGYPGILWLTG